MKKLNFIGKYFLMVFVLVVMGCEKEAPNAKIDAAQEIFFEVNYINFAWGKQVGGFLIDNTGAVKKITDPKHLAEDHKGQLTENQVKEKLAIAVEKKKEISPSELGKYTSLINSISTDKYSKRNQVGADMGSYTYIAYIYNKDEKVYKAIILAEEGDWSMENLDNNAKIITKWLKEIQEDTL